MQNTLVTVIIIFWKKVYKKLVCWFYGMLGYLMPKSVILIVLLAVVLFQVVNGDYHLQMLLASSKYTLKIFAQLDDFKYSYLIPIIFTQS